MILCHPHIETAIDFTIHKVNTLVIENPKFFRSIILGLHDQLSGLSGDFVLSENGKELNLGALTEIIDNCIFLSMNSKALLGKIASAMEQLAYSEDFYLETSNMLHHVEQYINDLSFRLDCDVQCSHQAIAGLLKASGLIIREEYESHLEKIVDYMELARGFNGRNLFIFINMRTFFSNNEIGEFFATILSHNYNVLLVDGVSTNILKDEKRITIDADLCEF